MGEGESDRDHPLVQPPVGEQSLSHLSPSTLSTRLSLGYLTLNCIIAISGLDVGQQIKTLLGPAMTSDMQTQGIARKEILAEGIE